MSMTFIYLIITLLVVVAVGTGVTRRSGWRSGFGAALATLLLSGGAFVGLLLLLLGNMG